MDAKTESTQQARRGRSGLSEREPLLSIRNLNVKFYTQRGVVHAVRDISFDIGKGETVALVGESGCGKSVTAHCINQLIPQPPGRIESGQIIFEGEDLLQAPPERVRRLRGDRISMIFQEPMTSLNPVFKIGAQIADVFQVHHKLSKKAAMERAVELLDLVKIPAPRARAHDYPHQLSGGMRQRAMIAMALASPNPGLLIADEPTTALDVTIQAQILELISELRKKISMSLLLITHDMGVVAETADWVVVMYAGHKVEEADVHTIFNSPEHPYTVGLLNSLPSNPKYRGAARLEAITGTVPDLITIGAWCPFENRCPYAEPVCRQQVPEARHFEDGHSAWCNFAGELPFSRRSNG